MLQCLSALTTCSPGFSRDCLLTPLFVDPAQVPAFQVRVAAGDSGACVTFYECLLTRLLVDSAQVLWASFCFRVWQFTLRLICKCVYLCVYMLSQLSFFVDSAQN